MILDAAPLVASAVADLPHPALARFTYAPDGVRLTVADTTAPERDLIFTRVCCAFDAADWDISARLADGIRVGVTFHPPWTRTLTGAPDLPFPPR